MKKVNAAKLKPVSHQALAKTKNEQVIKKQIKFKKPQPKPKSTIEAAPIEVIHDPIPDSSPV